MLKETLYVRVEPQTKAALSVIARQSVGEMSDHARVAIERYIESELAALTNAVGQGDTVASRRLAELRAAYTSDAI